MRWLRRALGALVALVILFEEWGWHTLQSLAALERGIQRLPPHAALAVLLLPALALLPLKLLGLWLLARGQLLASLVLVLPSKQLGTAVVAHLFALTRPALLRMPWFARGYARWVAWKTALLAQVRASWAWRQARLARATLIRGWQRWRSRQD